MSPPGSSDLAAADSAVIATGANAAVLDAGRDGPPPPAPPPRMRNLLGESSNESSITQFMNAKQWGIAEKINFCNIFGYHPFTLFSLGSNAANEDAANNNNGGRRQQTPGGKHKRHDKNVNIEYTVKMPENKESLERILRELGIDSIEELADHNSRKKKKKELLTKWDKKQQQQNNKKNQPDLKHSASEDQSEDEQTQKMDEVAVAASITKRCSSGAGQQSEEDDDQSYVSAQENLGGSNSRLSTPPAEFVDARQSRDEPSDSVMNDPNNYRDDDDVELLAKQLQQEEDEFITVGKNKKKNKKVSGTNDNTSASSTASSSSPPNRRNAHPDTKTTPASPVTNNSLVSSPPSGAPQQQQHQRNSNRPVAHPTTLGDFMETTKKETHKNAKHKKAGPGPVPSNKKQASFDEPLPESPTFSEVIQTAITVLTNHPPFSYADAAKKTSGENTPAHEMSPVPANASAMVSPAPSSSSKKAQSQNGQETSEKRKSRSPPPLETVPEPTFASAASGVQLPPSSAAAASAGISFGYEETPEDMKKRQQKKNKSASPPPQEKSSKDGQKTVEKPKEKPVGHQSRAGINGDQLMTLFDGNQMATTSVTPEVLKVNEKEKDLNTENITKDWEKSWKDFVNSGPAAIRYVPPRV